MQRLRGDRRFFCAFGSPPPAHCGPPLRPALPAPPRRLLALLLAVVGLVNGCAQLPDEDLSWQISAEELSAHVHFLAQPALAGRKPRSMGSWQARRYIRSRFEAYGLVPWGTNEGYEQSFRLGTNVIGVLPGADDNLAGEVVLVCAHYDHVGKDHKGQICPGAADNASGVAALLEAAERLALSEDKPKRSVCFAAFDCEETGLLGAFAFTCREDFEKTKIAAVVNVDVIGREFLDVVENAVFVTGTEHYPGIRQEVLLASAGMQLRTLPVGTDIVGPRGDHVAFETFGVPCLFFSSGEFRGYHTPADTPDRLDYQAMERSAGVISRTVEGLARRETIEAPAPIESGDRAELRAIRTVLAEVSLKYQEAGLTLEQKEALEELTAHIDNLSEHSEYSLEDRRRLSWRVAESVLPIMRDGLAAEATKEREGPKAGDGFSSDLFFFEVYRSHRRTLVETYRELVQHALKHKPGLFASMPKFSRVVFEVADDNIALVDRSDGRRRLSALVVRMSAHGELRGGRGQVYFYVRVRPKDCSGNLGEIVDYCLLQWRHLPADESYSRTWAKVLERVTGERVGERYEDWLQWHLAQADFANETQWVLALLRSPNLDLLREAVLHAVKIAPGDAMEALRVIAQHVDAHPCLRPKAVGAHDEGARKKESLVLVEVVGDPASREVLLFTLSGATFGCRKEPDLLFDASYPFYDHPWMQAGRETYERSSSVAPGGGWGRLWWMTPSRSSRN